MTIYNANGTPIRKDTIEGLDGFLTPPSRKSPSAEDFLLGLCESESVHMHLPGDVTGAMTFTGKDRSVPFGAEGVSIAFEQASSQVRARVGVEEGARFGGFVRQMLSQERSDNG